MSVPDKKLSVEIGLGDPRTSDRLHVVDLLCSVGKRCSGEVLDVSETGVRIKYTGAKRYQVGDGLGLALRRHDVLLLVQATVVWEKQITFNERLAGFQFDNLGAGDVETLREIMNRATESVNISKSA